MHKEILLVAQKRSRLQGWHRLSRGSVSMTPATSKLEKKELNLPSCRGPRPSSEECSHDHAKDKLMLVFTNPYLPFCVMWVGIFCFLELYLPSCPILPHYTVPYKLKQGQPTLFFYKQSLFFQLSLSVA